MSRGEGERETREDGKAYGGRELRENRQRNMDQMRA
jgi:hypothetical protein